MVYSNSGLFQSNEKEITVTHKVRIFSQSLCYMKETRCKMVYSVCFCLYDTQKEAKQIYGEIGQNRGYLWGEYWLRKAHSIFWSGCWLHMYVHLKNQGIHLWYCT